MASSRAPDRDRLRALLEAFQRQPFPGPALRHAATADAAFEIASAGSFLAGIASSLVHGGSVGEMERWRIARAFMEETFWLLESGDRLDLRDFPELLNQARGIENLRQVCWSVIAS